MKKKIKLFCISYSEREYTLLHSAVQLLYYPHPPKNNNKTIAHEIRGCAAVPNTA